MPVGAMAFEPSAMQAPGAPTIGTATGGDAQASVTFTPPADDGGALITGYTVTSSPGGLTGTGTGSPIVVTGLTNGTAYTFTVTATNGVGTGSASSASSSVIAGEWSSGTSYAIGDTVFVGATPYYSMADSNVGHDPAGGLEDSDFWSTTAPTAVRWYSTYTGFGINGPHFGSPGAAGAATYATFTNKTCATRYNNLFYPAYLGAVYLNATTYRCYVELWQSINNCVTSQYQSDYNAFNSVKV